MVFVIALFVAGHNDSIVMEKDSYFLSLGLIFHFFPRFRINICDNKDIKDKRKEIQICPKKHFVNDYRYGKQ